MRKKEGFLLNAGPSFMVLAILREGPRYGFDISKELARLTKSELKFPPGTLYPILHQMQRAGQIESSWEHPEGERARRVYKLTDKGRTEVERLIEAWGKYSNAVNIVIKETGGSSFAS